VRSLSGDGKEKAAALVVLDSHRGNVKRAARAAGVPRKTLSQWNAGEGGVGAEVVELHRQRATSLADLIEETVRKLIEGAAEPERIKDASLLELAKAVGIVFDKIHLLRGKPSAHAPCASPGGG
jgi:hypothetical protein